jgi:hypothetical protein
MPLNSIKYKTNSRTVSISRARRILGQKYAHLSDNQVREIINTLHLLAKEHLGYNGSKKAHTHEHPR